MQKTNNKTIAKNTLALYFRMGITMLVGLYTSRVILQVLGVTDMGINATVGGVVTFASFLNSALSNGTSRFLTIALGKEDLGLMKSTFSTCFWVHLILALIIALFMETIGLWFIYNQLVIPPDRMGAAIWVFHLGVISLIVTMIQVPYSSAIVAYERMDMYAYTSLVDVFLKLIIVYMLLLFDVDKLKLYSTLFFVTHLGMFFFYRWFCNTRFEGCRIEKQFDKNVFKPMLVFSGWQLFGSLSVNLYNNGILVLLNMFFAPAVVAARAISIQVNNYASQFMVNFRTASNPQIIKRFATGDFDGFKKLHLSTVKYSFYLMWLISLPIFLLSYPILELWLGEVPEYTDIFLKLVVIQGLFQVFDTGFWTAIYTKGRMKENALIAPFVCFLFFPIVYVIFKLGYSPVALSWAYIICYALLGLVEKPIILVKIVGYNWKDFPPLFWETFKVVAISVVLPVFAKYYITSNTCNSLIIAASVCSICIISVCLTVWIFGIDVETRKKIKSYLLNRIKHHAVRNI